MKLTLSLLFLAQVTFAAPLAIRNFEEIWQTYQLAMHTVPSPELKTLYSNVKETLPKKGTVDEYTTAMQVGIVKLSGGFCDALVKSDKAKSSKDRWVHKKVDFGSTPKAIDVVTRLLVLEEYADILWQRSPTAEELNHLKVWMEETAAELPDSSEALVPFFSSACVLVASSVSSLILY